MRLTKKQNEKIDRYILAQIDPEPYEVEPLPETAAEKLDFLVNRAFVPEKWSWERKRGTSLQSAMRDWLQGLPTVITIAFTNFDILQLAKSWGSIPENATEKQEDAILEKYWDFMAARVLRLANKYGIEIN